MQTIFDLRGVSYTYMDKFEALKSVDLKIDAGEQVAILGANGCGKSTLLSILDALLYSTSGEFYTFGRRVEKETFDSLQSNEFGSFFRAKVGFVFQNADVQLFSSTVFNEVAFGPLQLDLSHDEVKRRVDEVMSLVGISGLRDRAPHTLSNGEKKKVCIASVLSMNPDVLLLDEPTAGLDPRSQFWLIDLLQELAKAGKTIVTATHDLGIVEQISGRAVVFGEDHTVKVDDACANVLKDRELLISTNLIHPRMRQFNTSIHL
jgi:cobalt/nickel transport system ATP-binding protein